MADKLSSRGSKIAPIAAIVVIPKKKARDPDASGPGRNQPRFGQRSLDTHSQRTQALPSATPARPGKGSESRKSESTEESSDSRKAAQGVLKFSGKPAGTGATEGLDADSGSDSEPSNPKALSLPQILKLDPKQVKREVELEEKVEKKTEKKRRQQAMKEQAPVSRRDSDSSGELLTLDQALDTKPSTPRSNTPKPAPDHARRSSMTGSNPLVRAFARTPVGGLFGKKDNRYSPRNTIDSPRAGDSARKLRRHGTENEKTARARSAGGDAASKAQSPRAVEPPSKKASPRIKLSDSEAREFLDCFLEKQVQGMQQSNAKGGLRMKQGGPQTMFRSNESISWKGGEYSLTVLSDYLHQFFAQSPVAQAFQQCFQKLTDVDQDPYGDARDWITLVDGKNVLAVNEESRALLAIVTDSVCGASNTLESSQLPQQIKSFLSYLDESLSKLCASKGLPLEVTRTMRRNAIAGLLVVRGMSKLLESISRYDNTENKELWPRFAAALIKKLNESDEFFGSIMDSTDARLGQAPTQTIRITTGITTGITTHSAMNATHGADARTQTLAQVRSQLRSLWAQVATLDEEQLGFMHTHLDTMLTILDHPLLLEQAETIAAGFQEKIADLVASAAPARARASPVLPRSPPVSPVPVSNRSAIELPKVSGSTASSTDAASDASSSTDT